MLIMANGVVKSIMKKNVKTNKLNFRTKIMKKTNFQCCKKILLIKQKTLFNQSYKSIVCIVCKGRMWVSTALLLF